jgi:hypothetical protein
MPYCEDGDPPGEPDPHPLDSVIWRAVTSVQESLAEGDERARRYPADIARCSYERQLGEFQTFLTH